MASTFTKQIEYGALPAQALFHQSPAKFKLFSGGLGSGKTHAGAWESIRFCIRNAGCTFVVVSASYRILDDATKPMFFKLLPRNLVKTWKEGKQELTLINGTVIKFRSADDPDKLRGPNIAGFWIDEAGLCKATIWMIMLGRIRQKPYDLKGFVTTTPKGRNWVYNEFVFKNRDNPKRAKQYFMIQAHTKENIYNPPEYYESLSETLSGRWAQQELEGKFVAFEGLVYPDFDESVHVKTSESLESRTYERYVFLIDYGYTNPTAILVCGIDHDDRWYVLDEFYETKQTTPMVVDAVRRLEQAHHRPDRVWVDPSQAELIAQLVQAGFPAQGAQNAILDGILSVTNHLKVRGDGFPRLFISEKCKNLIREFGMYRYPEGKEERNAEEKPIKSNDHACDSLRYGIHSERAGGRMVMGVLV